MFDVTLTFDNGPTAATTEVLDILDAHGLKSTFFVIGKNAVLPGARARMERIVADGHRIGNHTWTHSTPLGQRQQEADLLEREIHATQRLFDDLAGEEKLFRPNGGGGVLDARLMDERVVGHLVDAAWTCVLWNNVPRDWVDLDGWVDTALAACQARPWSVVVLHDLPTAGAVRHLARFIQAVGRMGGRFRQDFAPECLPVVRGEIRGDIRRYATLAGPDQSQA